MTIEPSQAREKKIRSITLWGAFLNVCLMVLKIVSGLLVSSSALIADGVHSLSDLATDIVVLIGCRLSNRPADETHPYGHGKFETFTSISIAAVLLVVSWGLVYSAARSLLRGEQNFPGATVLVIAMVSVVSKETIFRFTRKVAKTTQSASLYANAWHNRSDALSSVAVLAGGLAGILGWGMADHVAAVFVGFMILAVAGKLLYDGLIELSEHSADKDTISGIEKILSEEERINGWHALRTRKLGGELFIDLHILVDPQISVWAGHEIATIVEECIKQGLTKPVNILIHVEPDKDDRHELRSASK
jgi:cation diffusion facilitator family transporter